MGVQEDRETSDGKSLSSRFLLQMQTQTECFLFSVFLFSLSGWFSGGEPQAGSSQPVILGRISLPHCVFFFSLLEISFGTMKWKL